MYNMDSFKYSNNYAWAGITVIMYNIWLEPLFSSMGDNPVKKINFEDVGFGYKKSTDSNYDFYSVLDLDSNWLSPKGNHDDIQKINNIIFYGVSSKNEYFNPYMVIVTNLSPNTSYDFTAYYTINGTKVNYNTQTIITLVDENKNLVLQKDSTWDSYIGTEKYTKGEESLNTVMTIVNQLCNISKTITVQIGPSSGAAHWDGVKIVVTSGYLDNPGTLLHETGHAVMRMYSDDSIVMKFMEWASHIPNAFWRWQYLHNYPVLSPTQSYRDVIGELYKVAAAFQVSIS